MKIFHVFTLICHDTLMILWLNNVVTNVNSNLKTCYKMALKYAWSHLHLNPFILRPIKCFKRLSRNWIRVSKMVVTIEWFWKSYIILRFIRKCILNILVRNLLRPIYTSRYNIVAHFWVDLFLFLKLLSLDVLQPRRCFGDRKSVV